MLRLKYSPTQHKPQPKVTSRCSNGIGDNGNRIHNVHNNHSIHNIADISSQTLGSDKDANPVLDNGLIKDTQKQYLEIDKNIDSDRMTAPVRRVPLEQMPYPPIDRMINIETRPIRDKFSYIGNLRSSVDNQILRLYGRHMYNGLYEYYCVSKEMIKSEIKTRNFQQLYDQDTVKVPLFGGDNDFIVHLHRINQFEYNLYISRDMERTN